MVPFCVECEFVACNDPRITEVADLDPQEISVVSLGRVAVYIFI